MPTTPERECAASITEPTQDALSLDGLRARRGGGRRNRFRRSHEAQIQFHSCIL